LQKGGVTPAATTVKGDCQTAALQQIAKGTLDAALMFRNEVTRPTGTKFLSIPDKQNVIFPFAYTTVGSNSGATAFVKYLTTESAKRILVSKGYLP
jgi:ABC-type molybdate transport system substrate-binding protein